MIINSISVSNFQCFYGAFDSNTIEFSDGINLIIADNGHGKSKLWNAFYWVIHDEIFDSDQRKFCPTSLSAESIISDKAKAECLVGATVMVQVTLKVEDSQGNCFKINRSFQSKKLDEHSWDKDLNSILTIQKYKGAAWQIVEKTVHQSILSRILPGYLKPYMWFQGEQVDGLMDFQSKTSLIQAINLLSDISDYDKLIEIATAGVSKAKSIWKKETGKLSKDQSKSVLLEEREKRYEDLLKKAKQDLNSDKDNLQAAKIGFDELVNSIDKAEERAQQKAKVSSLESSIKERSQTLDSKIESLNKKLFTSHWVLKDTQEYFNQYEEKYNDYVGKHHSAITKEKASQSKLPVDIPQPVFVKKMLSEQKCHVCGHAAPEGSEEYKHISSLLDRKQAAKAAFANDCSKFFLKLYNNGLSNKQVVENIEASISGEMRGISDLRSLIHADKVEIGRVQKMFGQLMEEDQSEHIVLAFNRHAGNKVKYNEDIAKGKQEIARLERALKDIDQQREKLVVEKPKAEFQLGVDVYKTLENLALSTRDLVFSNLVKGLEESANAIFQDMVKRNQSITGRLQLKILNGKSCYPEIVDARGHSLTGSNDSNIVLVKLALMMAVLKSRPKWSQNFSLVSDAPTSKMSTNYSQGFYEALGNNFRQSIVMTYDYVAVDTKQDIPISKLGQVVRLKANFPDGDRTRRDGLYTEIEDLG